MQTSDFDYQLPPDLIAQTPLEPRDASRLMTLDRATGQIDHHHFSDILNYLRPGDLMVFNQSRVIPARLYGHRKDTNGKVELLLLRRESPGVWQTLGKPGRRLRAGTVLVMEIPCREVTGILPASSFSQREEFIECRNSCLIACESCDNVFGMCCGFTDSAA